MRRFYTDRQTDTHTDRLAQTGYLIVHRRKLFVGDKKKERERDLASLRNRFILAPYLTLSFVSLINLRFAYFIISDAGEECG